MELQRSHESQEYKPLNHKDVAPEQKELSPEVCAIKIECELMKRFLIDKSSNEEKLKWIEDHSKEYRELFNDNQEEFIIMYKEEPEALYALLKNILEETKKPETKH
ncbi:MAG: hypothetical protein Athens071426_108 [Parcubacteria group bacterium Athens0714_26]|nr:MAG: hypothetical protein Athens101426_345 [Parcubacteria group bacterium Athens1014_26]TSD03714.1 MAG: hypothetical protein Athens071426_108 [Parcubacteria group bacterium Athens0714_26]